MQELTPSQLRCVTLIHTAADTSGIDSIRFASSVLALVKCHGSIIGETSRNCQVFARQMALNIIADATGGWGLALGGWNGRLLILLRR